MVTQSSASPPPSGPPGVPARLAQSAPGNAPAVAFTLITIPLRVIVVADPPGMTDQYIQQIIATANQSIFFRAAAIALGTPRIQRVADTSHVGTALAVVSSPNHHATMTDPAQERALTQIASPGGRLLRLVLVREFVSGGVPLGSTDLLGFTTPKIENGAVSSHPNAGRIVIRTVPINSSTAGAGDVLQSFTQLLMHETGHALGLEHDHESQHMNVMFHSVQGQHTLFDSAQAASAHHGAQLLVRR